MSEAEDYTPKPQTDESREAKQAEQEIVTSGKNQQPEMTLLLAPEAQSNPAVQEILKNVTLKLKTWRGTEIEIPLSEINMGGPAHEQARNRRYTICGNCGKRLPLTGDPQENHHAAMRHRLECARRDQASDEHGELVTEFEAQPNVIAMREAYARQLRDGIEGYMRVENLPQSGGPLRLPSTLSTTTIVEAQPNVIAQSGGPLRLPSAPAPLPRKDHEERHRPSSIWPWPMQDTSQSPIRPRRWWQFWRAE